MDLSLDSESKSSGRDLSPSTLISRHNYATVHVQSLYNIYYIINHRSMYCMYIVHYYLSTFIIKIPVFSHGLWIIYWPNG